MSRLDAPYNVRKSLVAKSKKTNKKKSLVKTSKYTRTKRMIKIQLIFLMNCCT